MSGTHAHDRPGSGGNARAAERDDRACSDAAPIARSAERVSVRLGHGPAARQAVHDASLRLRAGRWTAIVGPNGAGKTTLLRALAGLHAGVGTVRLFDRPLSDWPARERARTLAWLAQGAAADTGADDLSVHDVVMLGRLPHRGWWSPPSAQDRARVDDALRRTGAQAWRERALGELSGGERQRVLLARLLAVDAPVMLMDEPLANLDPPHQADWIALVRALVAQGRTVVSVLHEVSVALMADDLVVMREGRPCFEGPCDAPQAHRALIDAFDGRIAVRALDDRWVAVPR